MYALRSKDNAKLGQLKLKRDTAPHEKTAADQITTISLEPANMALYMCPNQTKRSKA